MRAFYFNRYIISLLFLLTTSFHIINAQKVGLVLSGGGAKGCTHIGVIRAMEENGIPIDYIAGTSIGAVVGALYSMGYSPDEIENLMSSDDFQSWKTGRLDEKSIYYFKKNNPTPEIMSLKMDINESFSLKQSIIPKSLIKPTQMNIVFVQLFDQANAACNGDFDSLMVPFRCVSSDVNNKKVAVLKTGDLGSAVRSSMSFPLLFKPVEREGRLLYDGGIYNNFPVNVMQSDFKPDFILGVSVGDEVTQTNTKSNIVEQIENMIMDRDEDFDYSPDSMLILDFKFKDVGLLDFAKIHELARLGYDTMITHIPDVRKVVHSYISVDSIENKRNRFKKKLHPLVFSDIKIDGGSAMQRKYVRRVIGAKEKVVIDFPTFKSNYYKLMSDSKIEEIQMNTVFNEEDTTYKANLKIKTDNHVKLKIGGFSSTNNSSQLYTGFSYQSFFVLPLNISLDAQLGQFYKGASMNFRSDFNTPVPIYLKWDNVYHSFSYYDAAFVNYFSSSATYIDATDELYSKIRLGFPLRRTSKLEFGLGYAKVNYNYRTQTNYNKIQTSTISNLVDLSALYGRSTFIVRQFPISGYSNRFVINHLTTLEKESLLDPWLQASWRGERYFKVSRRFIVGTFGEALYSTYSGDCDASISLAKFQPTIHSQLFSNSHVRSNSFVGIGLIPIWKFTDQLHLRSENYACVSDLKETEKNIVNISELNLVMQFHVFSINAYLALFNTAYTKPDYNFGVNLGYLLYNKQFIER